MSGMGRIKSVRRRDREKWKDPNGRHVRIYCSQMDSPAWIALSSRSMRLFWDMRYKLNGQNNGNIEAVFSELRHRGWKSKTTLHKALRELETAGFIAKTRQGGIASMSKICSLYRFTDLPCHEDHKRGIPATAATHDYRRFDSVRAAKAVLREAEKAHLNRRIFCKKVKVQEIDLSSAFFGH